MALSVWTERSGYRFDTIQERSIVNLQLPVNYGLEDVPADFNFKVISGKLPIGLRIDGDNIIGTPFEVPRSTDFEFVIRASYNNQIADRTFFWTIEGSDEPTWETAAGDLPLGGNGQYFILDSSYIDYKLVVTDFDTATGQSLKFFQPKNGGQLPPGLILTEDGRLVGWVQPALAIPETAGNGAYDNAQFDYVAYDFGYRPTNGYDSYIYDSLGYGYSVNSLVPKKLNRYYEFLVTVTDGDTSSNRQFRVFVVGDDYFRTDTVAINSGNGMFTADATYVRAPIWVTPHNLGIRRANNYLTFKLDTYEALELGQIVYSLDSVNPTMSGIAYSNLTTENKVTRNLLRIKNVSAVPTTGLKLSLKDYVTGAGDTTYNVTNVQTISDTEYVLTLFPALAAEVPNNRFIQLGTVSVTPPGMQFDQGTAEVFGVVPYQPAITQSYSFTVTATRYSDTAETASAKRTFNVQIIGEVDSVMTWNSPSTLGSIGANFISSLSVSASSTMTESIILYVVESGSLPPGLTLDLDGEIVGKVTQFGTLDNPGLITFDSGELTIDEASTTIDRSYTFSVQARDILNYSAISKTFTININTPNDRLYSNLYVKPFLKQSQRDLFREFITDSNIFTANSIYRPSDLNFGIQQDLKMMIFAGIETKTVGEVVGAIGRNHKTKKFKFGDVKKAKAKTPGTNDVIYEIVYVEIIDPLEIGKVHLPARIITSNSNRAITADQSNQYYNGPFDQDTQFFSPADPFSVSVDSSGIFADDPYTSVRYPASVEIWRDRIKSLGLKERNYLPLWMRTIQDGEVQELDYVKAIPLCYCKPGMADDILLNIKNRAFDFKQIDYVIDRYIIDSVTGYSADKYIAFKNDRTTIT
jgi:hypothetical protein